MTIILGYIRRDRSRHRNTAWGSKGGGDPGYTHTFKLDHRISDLIDLFKRYPRMCRIIGNCVIDCCFWVTFEKHLTKKSAYGDPHPRLF